MVDLKALVAEQRAKAEKVVSEPVEIVLGGELVTVLVERLHPDLWDALMLANPPRKGSSADDDAGYNVKGVTLAYPRLMVDGEALSKDDFAEVYRDLDSTWRNAIGVMIWGVNVNHALQERRSLGKAIAGRKSP